MLGRAIARISNIPLFAKEFSPQTTWYYGKKNKLWIPYRIEGGRGEDYSSVTTASLLKNWKNEGPITLIARTNGELMFRAMELMGLRCLRQFRK